MPSTYTGKQIGIIALLLVCIFSSIFFWKNEYSKYENIKIPVDDISITTSDMKVHKFRLLLADTPELQEKGLGGRASLDEYEAMLFPFEKNSLHYFWMKDMHFPIDMVWLNADKKVMFIQKDVATSTYPNPFGPAEPSKYVIEYNAGISEQIHLQVGDNVTF